MPTPVLDLFRPGVFAVARLLFDLELRGTDNIPATGPVVITPNHQTYADPALVTIPFHRPIYYMAWRRLFTIPVFGRLIRRLRAFPVDIESADPRATREAVRLLQAGEAVMIFPEGGRSHDGQIGRFRLGAFRLAVSLNVPMMPVTISGGYECWPPARALPRRGHMAVVYHALVYPDQAREPRDAARHLAERVRTVIAGAFPTRSSA